MNIRVVKRRDNITKSWFLSIASFYLVVAIFFSATISRASSSLPAEMLYARGSQAYALGSYQEASDQLSQAAAIGPERADIRLALGLCYLALKKYQEALHSFQVAISLDSHIKDGLLYLGITKYCLGEYQQAEKYLRNAKEQDPEKGLISYYLGLCEIQMNHPQQGLKELQEGYHLSPEFASYFKPYEEILLTPVDVQIKKFRQEVAVGLNYDSNVELHTRPYYLATPARKSPKYTDWGGILGDRTEYYPLIRDDFNLGLRFNGSDSGHLYLQSWDFLNLKGEAFINWRLGPFVFKPFFAYDRTWYGNGKPFSTFNIPGLTIDWPETSFLKGEATYRARDKNFWYSRGDEYHQSGWDHRIDLFQAFLLPARGIMRLGIFYDRDLAQGLFWASHLYGATANATVFLPWDLTGWLNFEYGQAHFDNTDEWSGRRQLNDNYCLQLLVKKPLNERLAFWFGYGYANTRANIPEWQFNRSLFQAQFTWNLY
ncbi:MAG: tetratricopeptide repeat protein [Deltaproteobacteria bacterium]|nr:tetratricopeptide repeat protein [Deltaproteobacteria bacterium]